MSGITANGQEAQPTGGHRSKTHRATALFIAFLGAVGLAAALACIVATYDLARQSDAQHADTQRAALRVAVGEFRALFGNGNEVDPRFLRMLAQSALLKDVRFESDPAVGSREVQPVANAQGRIVGFLSWQDEAPMTEIVERLAPLIGAVTFGLVALTGGSFWRARRSRAELAQSEQHARDLIERDTLTGLPNNLKMVGLLDAAMTRRSGQDVICYALLALTGMRSIVETYGQHGADEIIGIVGARLRDSLSAEVDCGRVGDHSFGLLWRGDENPMALLRNAIETVRHPHWIDTVVRIGAHAGFAQAPRDATTRDELIRRAQLALCEAEKNGPGEVIAFEHKIDAVASEQQFIRRELPRALSARALDLHYQPIIASEGGRVAGVEALLRWTHSDRGAISPAKFVPVAEQMGLMDQLGAFVLRRALEDAKKWPDFYISVNLSPLQVRDRRIIDVVQHALQESGTAPSKLMLEITEGVLIDNPEEMLRRIEELRALGVRIALDDFGSGYSSLGYLQRFPFDKLKIDRSFVTTLGRSPNAAVIIQAIVALGRALGVTVVVEGVETEEQRVLLRLAGCDEMQGFLFARPAPAATIDLLIAASETKKTTAA